MSKFFAIIPLLVMSYMSNNDPLQESMERGKKVYTTHCISCHMDDGKGMAKAFPPLAQSDYLMADTDRSIRQVLFGAYDPMVVNGVTYQMPMVGFKESLSDQDVADVLNYVRNSWGNEGEIIKPERVSKQRKKE